MDIKSLKYFLAVAKQVNFTKAAEECCITQTAMSKQIQKLEASIGIQLFERDPRQVKLTAEGKSFHRHALDLLEHYELILKKTKNLKREDQKLTIGIGLYEHDFVAKGVKKMQEHYPELKVLIVQSHYNELIANLKQGIIDIAFTLPTGKHCVSKNETNFKSISPSNLNLLVSEKNLLAINNTVSIQQLKNSPLITLSQDAGPCALPRLKQLVKDAGGEIKKPIIARDIQSQILMVELGLGVAFFPDICTAYIPSSVKALKLKDFSTGSFLIMYQKSNNNPLTSIFFEMM